MRLHLHRERHVRQGGDAGELRRHLGVIGFDEVGHVALAELACFQHRGDLLGGFLDLDEVAGLELVARDVDAAAVHLDVAVIDELARGEHGGDELGAIDHGVETALEQADQVFTGIALHAAGFDIDAMELALGDVGVVTLQLLLGAQLHAEVGELALAALAVLAGAVFPAVHRALRAAPDILAHTAIDLVFRLTALSHRVLFAYLSVEETRPPVRREFPGADKPNPQSLKGRATGRETQRGPKTAREQEGSREKPLLCQMKAPVISGVAAAPKPKSQDAGFNAWHRPAMTAEKAKIRLRPPEPLLAPPAASGRVFRPRFRCSAPVPAGSGPWRSGRRR